MNTALSCLSFRNVQFDVVDQHGQPWLRSSQIAEALGYGQENRITDLYNRNADEFTDAMTSLVKLHPRNEDAGQMREVRIFSLRGCHLLGMFARTAIAKEFRKWALDVLDQQAAFNAHPDIEMYGTIAEQMAEHFLDYLTGEIADGPQAVAGLPPLQRATRVTTDQIILEALDAIPTKSLQVQVGLTMRRLGWTRKQRATTGDRSRYYQRPA
jgi:prophage antirepressor-like protein